MTAVAVSIDSSLAGRLRLGVLTLRGLAVTDSSPALGEEIAAYCRTLRERFPDAKSSEVPGVDEARRLYHALGIDPTKTRPSNEALLRRVLKGEALYRIHTLVDAINLSSLRAQLPFGLYDLAHVEPPVVLRRGAAGESYDGIRKGPVHLEGRPMLADARGPFGNPTSDSARTMITTDTREALVIVYAPAGTSDARLNEVLSWTAGIATRVCGGREESRAIVG